MKKGILDSYPSLMSALAIVAFLTITLSTNLSYAGQEKSGKALDAMQMEVTQVNINRADAQTLAIVLRGIGLTKAQAIVDYRKANGKFEKVEDLAEVRGIGEATVNKNRKRILL